MKKYLLFFAATLIYVDSSAQVFVNSYDSSHVSSIGIFGSSKEIYETIIPPIDTGKINIISNGLYKSAESKTVDISPILEASKDTIGTDFIFRQKIIAQKGMSIAITFDKLSLSKNAELYLYNSEGTVITGPITAKENIGPDKINKTWSSNSFMGSSVILELKIPQEEVNQNELHIVNLFWITSYFE